MLQINEMSDILVAGFDQKECQAFFEDKDNIFAIRCDQNTDMSSEFKTEVFSYSDKSTGYNEFHLIRRERILWECVASSIDYQTFGYSCSEFSFSEYKNWVLTKGTPEFDYFFLLIDMRVL